MTWHEYVALPPSVEPTIESRVLCRLHGRLTEFQMERCSDGIILLGTATSYHVKQLAQQEVAALTKVPIYANCIEVRAPKSDASGSGIFRRLTVGEPGTASRG